jgi:hypothetical protein
MRTLKSTVFSALLALLLSGGAAGAAEPATANSSVREVRLKFADLGADAIALHGVQSSAGVNFGIRGDEVVVAAALNLHLTYSPSMLPDLSHMRVALNGQILGVVPLSKADAGHDVERTVALDPRYFSDYNQLLFDLIGHYSLDCEDPQHSSLWANISRQSELVLTLRSIELRNDLALLPAPFFDRHDNRRLVLPIVLGANASHDMVRSAGVAASWFGVLADYRSARFPASIDALPPQHALVFATNASKPASLNLPAVDAPTVSIVDSPVNPSFKLLVFQGRDDAQLRQAVEGVVLGNAVLTGDRATVAKVAYERRAAYDAPRWLRTDRPVKLGELIDSPNQLQTRGVAPPPLSVNLRLPPDLFTWNKAGVPIDLHYRYTAPSQKDNSLLTVSVNNQLLRSYRLAPESESGAAGKFLVPLIQNDGSRESRGLLIPAFQIASDNLMQFQFAMDMHREAMCKEVFVDNTREAIDPDSTVDISAFPHYAALPNLALFANAGFPFTRYADLQETAIVMPASLDRAALEQMFFILGRMGRQTGAPALGFRLIGFDEAQSAKDVDLLVLSGAGSNELLERWGKDLSLVFGKAGRDFKDVGRAPGSAAGPQNPRSAGAAVAPKVLIQANGSLGAFMGFESRVSSGRSVVAMLGTDAAAADSVLNVLEDESKVSQIRGDLVIVRNAGVQSFQGGGAYYVGSLSWWQWLWFHFSRHALLLTAVSLIAAVVFALLLYGWLQRLVARRLEGRKE